MEREAWKLHWLLAPHCGKDVPTVDQILGRAKPNPPADPFGEVLRIIDPQAFREREWTKEHMN